MFVADGLKADPSMSPIVSDSIAYYLGREACK